MIKRISLALLGFSLLTVFSAVTDCGCTYAHALSAQKTPASHASCHRPQDPSGPLEAQDDCCVNCQLEKAAAGTEFLNYILYGYATHTETKSAAVNGVSMHSVNQDWIHKPTGPPSDPTGTYQIRQNSNGLYLALNTLRI